MLTRVIDIEIQYICHSDIKLFFRLFLIENKIKKTYFSVVVLSIFLYDGELNIHRTMNVRES